MSEEAVWTQNGGRLLIETPVVARDGPAGWEKYPVLRLSPCLLYTNIHKYTLKNRSLNLGLIFSFSLYFGVCFDTSLLLYPPDLWRVWKACLVMLSYPPPLRSTLRWTTHRRPLLLLVDLPFRLPRLEEAPPTTVVPSPSSGGKPRSRRAYSQNSLHYGKSHTHTEIGVGLPNTAFLL